MREILFRGKHIHILPENEHLDGTRGKWIYGYLCDEDYINSQELGAEFLIDHETVCQYTGLRDKNGEKIFEGDILQNDENKVGQVQWFEEHSAFMIWNTTDNKVHFLYDNDFSKIEVIGNIFDNPELLEVGNEID